MTDTTTAGDTKASPSPPRFVGGPVRTETLTLECPLEFDGKVYETITARRLTGRELDDCPDAVVKALDASDSMRLNEVAGRFFPRPDRPSP